nr:hypothetical protein [Tanacetum cinerariifolium]
MEKSLSLTNVMVSLAEPLSSKSFIGEASTFAALVTTEPITTLSTTFASSEVVPLLLTSDDQASGVEPHDEEPLIVSFEKEEVVTSPELQTFHVRGMVFPLRSLSLYAPLPNASVTSWSLPLWSKLASVFRTACFILSVDEVSWTEAYTADPGVIVFLHLGFAFLLPELLYALFFLPKVCLQQPNTSQPLPEERFFVQYSIRYGISTCLAACGSFLPLFFWKDFLCEVKVYQKKDKIGSKPDKNGKRGEAEKSQKQLQSLEEEKLKKMKKEGSNMQSHSKSYKLYLRKKEKKGLICNYLKEQRKGLILPFCIRCKDKGPSM